MEKPCISCGKIIIKKTNESKARFEKKSFCSTVCSYKYMKSHSMGWWNKNNDYPSKAS
jgi:hypothetical protein